MSAGQEAERYEPESEYCSTNKSVLKQGACNTIKPIFRLGVKTQISLCSQPTRQKAPISLQSYIFHVKQKY